MYPPVGGWRAARGDGPRPAALQAGRARVHPGYNVLRTARRGRLGAVPAAPSARAGRYAAVAAASGLVAGSPAASGAEAAGAVASW
jgi:hypothetical protein